MILKWLKEDLNSFLEDHKLVLFFDPHREFKEILKFLEEDFRILRVEEEGFLKVKYLIEYSQPHEKFVVYLPFSYTKDKNYKPLSYLEEYIFTEKIFEKSLYIYLKEKGVKFPTDRKGIAEIKKVLPSMAVESIGQGMDYWQNRFFKDDKEIILPDFKEKLFDCIRDPTGTTERLNYMLNSFIGKLESDLGISVDFSDPQKAQFELLTKLCFSEIYAKTGKPDNYPFRELMAAEAKVEDCQKISESLRNHQKLKEVYKDLTFKIEETYNVEGFAESHTLNHPEIETFITFDEVAFNLIKNEVDSIQTINDFVDLMKKYRSFIKTKLEGFWSLEGEINIWRALDKVCSIIGYYEEFLKDDFVDITNKYCAKYFEIDKKYREYIELVAPEEGAEKITEWVDRIYLDFLDRLNSKLDEPLISSGKVKFDNLTHQENFWKSLDLSDKRRIAVIFVDALRYELGKELQERLSSDFKVIMQPMYAQIPTVTEIGMSFLLSPKNPKISCTSSGLQISEGKFDLSSKKGRKDYLKQMKANITFAELHELSKKPVEDIAKMSKTVVVFSRDFDLLGESGGIENIKYFSDALGEYAKVIRKLIDGGYSEVHIVTDHGFLTFEDSDRRFKISDKPNFPNNSKRYACGEHLEDHNLIRLDVPFLEEGCFYFPRSIYYFRVSSFLHGGTSLQELIIPHLVVESKIGGVPKFEIKLETESTVYNKIFEVKIIPKETIEEKTVEIFAQKDDKIISNMLALNIGFEGSSQPLRLKETENINKGEKIKVIARDQETKEILDETEKEVVVDFDEFDL